MTKRKSSENRRRPKQSTEPTEREKTALRKQLDRMAAAPAAPRVKVAKDKEAPTISLDHPDQTVAFGLLKEALGDRKLLILLINLLRPVGQRRFTRRQGQ